MHQIPILTTGGSNPFGQARKKTCFGKSFSWGKYDITVNSICPGYFYTDLTRETLNSDFFRQNAKTMIPMERYGNEGELDSATLFFAAKESSYVTGTNLAVDGGYTCM